MQLSMSVFRVAVMKNAISIIVIHNPLSDVLALSKENLAFTDGLIQIGKILDTKLIDHLIH